MKHTASGQEPEMVHCEHISLAAAARDTCSGSTTLI